MTYSATATRYDAMPYRRCGASGLKLPAISLGLWHNFGDIDALDTQRALRDHGNTERLECLDEEGLACGVVADTENDVIKHGLR